jgi:hypothetical protein
MLEEERGAQRHAGMPAGGTGARGRGLIRGIFAVAARAWTFDRFREEVTKPRLSDFEMR